jgi:hypothetical protein
MGCKRPNNSAGLSVLQRCAARPSAAHYRSLIAGAGSRGSSYSIAYDERPDPTTGERRQRERGGYGTREEAEDALALAIAAVRSGGYVEPSKVTVARFLADWVERKAQDDLEPSTAMSYRQKINLYLIPGSARCASRSCGSPRSRTRYERSTARAGQRVVPYRSGPFATADSSSARLSRRHSAEVSARTTLPSWLVSRTASTRTGNHAPPLDSRGASMSYAGSSP